MTIPSTGTATLVVEDLSFAYSAGTPILTNFSETFAAGEMAAVTGASGRGKSTLLYLLGLMLRPSSGSVTIQGQVASGLNDAERASIRATQIGFVFQDAALDPTRTVLANVLEGSLYRGLDRHAEDQRAHDLLERFGVAVRPNAKPGQISGGQAQRIALCRALLHQPCLVLADEPTGNLDAESATLVIAALREHAREGGTVLAVTHDHTVVASSDRRIAL